MKGRLIRRWVLPLIAVLAMSTGIAMPRAAFASGDDYPNSWETAGLDAYTDDWGYPVGECTSFAMWRSFRDGHFPINALNVRSWGDAQYWYVEAAAHGFGTGTTPTVGAIMVWGPGDPNTQNHVGYVEYVYSKTLVLIDDYNWGDGKFHEWQTAATSKFIFLPTIAASRRGETGPALASKATTSQLDLFMPGGDGSGYRGQVGKLYHKQWTTAGWTTGWDAYIQPLPMGKLYGRPAAAWVNSDRWLYVAATNWYGHLYFNRSTTNGASWDGWIEVAPGFVFNTAPTLAADPSGTELWLWVGSTSGWFEGFYTTFTDGGTNWYLYQILDGPSSGIGSAPSVAMWGSPTRMDLVVLGNSDSVLWDNHWTSPNSWQWQGWQGYPGVGILSAPSVVTDGSTFLDVFFTSTAGSTEWADKSNNPNGNNFAWYSIGSPGGAIPYSEAATAWLHSGEEDVYEGQEESDIATNWWTPSGWHGWLDQFTAP